MRTSSEFGSVKLYDSDFGTLEVVPNRFMRARDVLVGGVFDLTTS